MFSLIRRIWINVRGNGIENLSCMAYSGTSYAEVIAAGPQSSVLLLNIDRGSVVKQVISCNMSVNDRNQPRNGTQSFVEDG